MIKSMDQPQPAPEEDPEKDWFPNRGVMMPPEDPEMPKPGTLEYQKMMEEAGEEDQTSAALKFLDDLQELSD